MHYGGKSFCWRSEICKYERKQMISFYHGIFNNPNFLISEVSLKCTERVTNFESM
jgi:hypothetical protein